MYHVAIPGIPVMKVHCDHKPLSGIMQKQSKIGFTRLQRFALKLLLYNSNVVYVPGRNLHFPNTLSRYFLKETEENLNMLECYTSVNMCHLVLTKRKG